MKLDGGGLAGRNQSGVIQKRTKHPLCRTDQQQFVTEFGRDERHVIEATGSPSRASL